MGTLKCRICSTGHTSRIHHLSAAVDVYCDWIDECHKANTKEAILSGGPKVKYQAAAAVGGEISD